MPAPTATALSSTAKQSFASQGIRLPMDWDDMGRHFSDAFTSHEQQAPANAPTNLFREPSLNRYHTDASRTVGRNLEGYIDGICASLSDAVDKWMKAATVVSVLINGPVGTLLPGGVTGPPLQPIIMSTAPCKTEYELAYSNAIAQAVSSNWSLWHQGLSGILTYPTFAAAPMPMAPPTPNTPVPLATLVSAGEAGLSPFLLKNAMATAFGTDGMHADTLFSAVAQAFYTQFQTFKATTLVTNVLGTGPVATPPAGPVTAGMVIPTPGNFV